MNNDFINKENEDVSDKTLPIYREQATQLTEVIEALRNIQGSSYWKVLQQKVFDVDLDKAKRRLAIEKDTTEMFRLQGEIRWGEKFNLEDLIQKKQNELLTIRKNINE